MCGIAGILTNRTLSDTDWVEGARASMAHRGPDDGGWLRWETTGTRSGRIWDPSPLSPGVLFLHQRLTILDLSETGWQPMSSRDGRYHIVYNGEIYNYLELRSELVGLGHRFRSTSDTEVLLSAYIEWGEQALSRLVGMFAFAVLDTLRRELFVARDFFGIKPLYYSTAAGRFSFASELKTLLRMPGIPRRANDDRVMRYLNFGPHGGDDQTFLAAVRQLPPAHHLTVGLDQPTDPVVRRFWKTDPGRHGPPPRSVKTAAAELRHLFLDSVRLHLRSDVPVGAALSGGVDSSSIVAAMRHLEPDLEIHAFSYVADAPDLSEERWVEEAATSVGAVVHRVRPKPVDLLHDVEELIHSQDEPVHSTSMYAQARVFRLAQETGIKVMLDGQGADELLGGYLPYTAARLASFLRRGRWLQAGAFLRAARRLPGRDRMLWQVNRYLLPPAGQAAADRLRLRRSPLPWIDSEWRRGAPGPPPVDYGRLPLRAALDDQLTDTSVPNLLRFEDRNSMAHSVESRVPFLTPQLADYLQSLPEDHLVAPDGTTKAVFRMSMRGLVPDPILDRVDKIGFETTEATWVAELDPWVGGLLDRPAPIPMLDLVSLRRAWRDFVEGRSGYDRSLWRALNLVGWVRSFRVTFD